MTRARHRRARRAAWLAGALTALGAAQAAGCGDDQPYDAVCGARRARPGLELGTPFCERLSTYRFFDLQGAQRPAQGVLPYDLTTPLFADHALKDRFLWLPPGTAMTWSEPAALGFPIGAVIIKTFSFPIDQRHPERGRQLIETRLLVRRERAWEGVSYRYDADGEARLAEEGAEVELSWIDAEGAAHPQLYLVPNKNQCKNCHEETEGTIAPLGPKARHLHRPGAAGSGIADQLVFLRDAGLLREAPPVEQWPRSPAALDPTSGSLDQRARAWLDITCAHCHNPHGAARTSGLDLSITALPAALGVCKAPVATGRGSAGRRFDIVPGRPEESIVMARLESNEPEVKMPELGRTLIDVTGVALIREWINAMPGACAQ
jgi:uncharacterized repeat protein (TIGR03806 family)